MFISVRALTLTRLVSQLHNDVGITWYLCVLGKLSVKSYQLYLKYSPKWIRLGPYAGVITLN